MAFELCAGIEKSMLAIANIAIFQLKAVSLETWLSGGTSAEAKILL